MTTISGLTKILVLSIFVLSFPFFSLSNPSFEKLQLPSMVMGPESLAFDLIGGGPYTGVLDGRILKYGGPKVGFQEFAFTSPNRSKALCDGTTDPDLGPVCGRPLGLAFNYLTNELYIADAYFGLMVAGRNGRLATQISTSAGGVPFTFTFLSSLDIDPLTGTVYFTDANSVFQNSTQSITSGDSTGRLLKYDPKTKQVTVLMKGLSGAAGSAVSANGTFVLVSELIGNKTQSYWLKGSKANTAEVFLSFGRPDNIKRTVLGDFWLAAYTQDKHTMTTIATGQRINGFGKVVRTVSLDTLYNTTRVSEVLEFLGASYIGSPFVNFIGVYKP